MISASKKSRIDPIKLSSSSWPQWRYLFKSILEKHKILGVISHDLAVRTAAIVQPADPDDFATAGPEGVMEMTPYGAIQYKQAYIESI